MEWLSFNFVDVLDILLFSVLLYYLFRALRKGGNSTLLVGIITFVIMWVLFSRILSMRLMGRIMDYMMGMGLLVLVILFQDDIRRFLTLLGSTNKWLSPEKIFRQRKRDQAKQQEASYIAMMTFACLRMAKKKVGALIVIENNVDLTPIAHTGELLNADVNSRLIENIFYEGSPLHDGAMIIRDRHILAAACILPVAHGSSLPKEMGLRHRSGLGVSQQSDARVIIVSEERGEITIAYRGEIVRQVDSDGLRRFLSSDFSDLSTIGPILAPAAA